MQPGTPIGLAVFVVPLLYRLPLPKGSHGISRTELMQYVAVLCYPRNELSASCVLTFKTAIYTLETGKEAPFAWPSFRAP